MACKLLKLFNYLSEPFVIFRVLLGFTKQAVYFSPIAPSRGALSAILDVRCF